MADEKDIFRQAFTYARNHIPFHHQTKTKSTHEAQSRSSRGPSCFSLINTPFSPKTPLLVQFQYVTALYCTGKQSKLMVFGGDRRIKEGGINKMQGDSLLLFFATQITKSPSREKRGKPPHQPPPLLPTPPSPPGGMETKERYLSNK